jgi:SAM-dependent methyltransferase
VTTQPGYDALAEQYDATFPAGSLSPPERAAMELFADALRDLGSEHPVIDIGCGTGHQAHDLATQGFRVIGVDPSGAMLEHARRRYPQLHLVQGDAGLSALPHAVFSGVLARYSLIHVPPQELDGVLAGWGARLQPGGVVMTAFQSLDAGARTDVAEFDHAVAPAWRWRPDTMAEALAGAGLVEHWRLVTRPGDGFHRFPECHLLVRMSHVGSVGP